MAKNKEKLQKILANLSRPDVRDAFKSVEKEMVKVADKLRVDAETKTVEMAKKRIAELKEQIQSIFEYLGNLKEDLKKSESDLSGSLNQKLDALKSKMAEYRNASLERLGMLSAEIDGLKDDIREISGRKIEIPDFQGQITQLENELEEAIFDSAEYNDNRLEEFLANSQKTITDLDEEVKKLRRDTMSAIASRGGGNMNRNILVGNNPSTLGRYTDLNIKAGANVTLSYTNNDNLKTTDLTISAPGGGSGINRNISTVIVSSVVAEVAATDYVVIAGAGIQLTLPTAVGNTNLYTIKNKSTSSVLVNTTGGQTIDDGSTALMQTQYTAIDLISDNANWHVT